MADSEHTENSPEVQEIPYGYCQCGCGQLAPLSDRNCPSRGYVKGKPHKFIQNHNGKRERNNNWKGGRIRGGGGNYMLLHFPGHPRTNRNGYVLEHILIAEKALGKYLPPKAIVHHHTPDQLVVCQDQAYHLLLHRRARALKECGHASWRKCPFCQKWDNPENMRVNKYQAVHRSCANEYDRKRRLKRAEGLAR